MSEDAFASLKAFFDRAVAQKATGPLRNGVQISLDVDGRKLSLVKEHGRAEIRDVPAVKPDMSFTVPSAAVAELVASTTEDIGEIGVSILKLMASEDEKKKVRAKVHIGGFALLTNGYLGVLPLGGATVMKFLATKGMGGLSKIKDGISKLRD